LLFVTKVLAENGRSGVILRRKRALYDTSRPFTHSKNWGRGLGLIDLTKWWF
jgi:hypothetical protein